MVVLQMHVMQYVKDLRQTDGGFFGSGVYLTPNSNYAAVFSTSGKQANKNGQFTLLLCYAVVGLTYPISRATDYDNPNLYSKWSISKYHSAYPIPQNAIDKANCGDESALFDALLVRNDKALKDGFDSHFIAVSEKEYYHAVKAKDATYFELVVKEETQVVPYAVIYFKK